MYTLCTTAESVSRAVKSLTGAEYVIIDCEGHALGRLGGALSLISLGTPHARSIYIFDVLSIPQDALESLYSSILSSKSKMKVVWDGRMDYIELFASYNCSIENVLDLQLVDIISRTKRGQGTRPRLGRFARKKFPMSEVRKLQLEGCHVLNGMDDAIREHKINGLQLKNEEIKKLHAENLSEIWMQRPLKDVLLAYAASDIKRIAGIHDHFKNRGYLNVMGRLVKLSSLYVSMHRQAGKVDPENIRGPYLPLSIPLTASGRSAKRCNVCTGCRLTIPEQHFPLECVSTKKTVDKASKAGSRSHMCKICTLILAKANYAEELKAKKEEKEKKEGC